MRKGGGLMENVPGIVTACAIAIVALSLLAIALAIRIHDLRWQVQNLKEWIEHDRAIRERKSSLQPPIPTVDVPTDYIPNR